MDGCRPLRPRRLRLSVRNEGGFWAVGTQAGTSFLTWPLVRDPPATLAAGTGDRSINFIHGPLL